MNAHFCPNCGCNMTRDEVVERDGWTIDPVSNVVRYGDKAIRMTRQMIGIMHTLAASKKAVRLMTIVNRVSDNEISGDVVRVQVLRIRKHAEAAGAPNPIATARGIGYEWQEAA